MKPFFNSRVKRNTAFMVFFAWLFALASGAANACLIEPSGAHTHGSVAASALAAEDTEEAETAPEHGVGAVDHHHHDSEGPATPCQKVCDEGSKSLPKQQSTSAPIDSGLAPFFAAAWTTSAAAIVSAPSQAFAYQPPRPRLSVRVLFSRLAL